MKKIVLLCAAGMSTSLLVSRMKESAEKIGLEADIAAYPIGEADSRGKDADVVLIGPQVRYALGQVQKKLPNTPVATIDMLDYGRVDGEKVLKHAIELMGE